MKKILATVCVLGAVTGCSMTSEHSNSSLQSKYTNYLDVTSEFNPEIQSAKVDSSYWKVTSNEKVPKYPIEAAKKKKDGCVVVDIAINSNGKLEDYSIKESFPKGLFDKSTINALKTWQWEATNSNKQKQPVISRVQLDFNLNLNRMTSLNKRTNSVCDNFHSSLMNA